MQFIPVGIDPTTSSVLLMEVILAKVLIAFFDSKKDFAVFVSQFATFLSKLVLIIHFSPRLLRVFHVKVVDEGMRAVLAVLLSVLHPNSPDTPMLLEDCLKGHLIWQLQSD